MINKKNGFTLIELLAVIVILAIIAVITVAIIGNIINSSKRKSAENSLYGYIETVELYQTRQILLGKSQLKESTIYNVSKETVIDDKTVEPLNNLIDIKGTKPTGGTISISKNGTVGVATLCINDYLVEYKNNEISTSDDCGDIGLLINYNIDTPDWAKSKTLTIEYPEGNFDYYLKLDKGNAKINDKVITAGEEIKVESPAELLLTENSEISTWILKGSKKLSLRKYTELKIDNVELKEPEIVTSAGYPSISTKGISISSNLTLNYTQQDGTSAYYSVDDGLTWNKYTSTVSISGSKVKAKLVRDVSKIESKTVEKSISTATDSLASTAYDGDKSTYFQHYLPSSSGTITKTVIVDSSMVGKSINYSYTAYLYSSMTVSYYNNESLISTDTIVYNNKIRGDSVGTSTFTLPENTTKIVLTFKTWNASSYVRLNELAVNSVPTLKVSNFYPTITSEGIKKGYQQVSITYFTGSNKKLYRIGSEGDWQEYNAPVKVTLGQTIYAKGVTSSQKDLLTASHSASITDALASTAYDGDKSTYFQHYLPSSSGTITKTMSVDSSVIGKSINYSYTAYLYSSMTVSYYNNESLISTDTIVYNDKVRGDSVGTSTFTLPENTTKIVLTFKTWNASSYVRLNELTVS